MATQNNIDIKVNVSDGGTTAQKTKEAQKLKDTFDAAAKSAQSVGGTPGSRAIAAQAATPIKTSKTSAAPTGSQKLMGAAEYSEAQGAAQAAGGTARDFAKQAQGLDGIVRLYAIYAANLYAVGAAFRALSTAMDTSNMVKGLDQLSASSGMALGSLSKRLVEATDGAISLREAMEAVAKASSSGMSSKNILRMGEVAKQASQALGIDMSDAMSRITRAATKLEPELVDELGLFTKTGKASEDYAKAVGKSVSQLSDFEKRMAYSNALLAEGEKKFSEIKLDTNPYTKLAATLKDLTQSGLDLVNNVLAPIAGYLSKSPTALALGLAAIGSVLLKQAIPAIGQFKEGLAKSADQAKEVAVKKAADAARAMSMINEQILQKLGDVADDKVAAVDAAEKKVLALQQAGISKASKAYKLLQMDIRDVTEEHIRGVEERAKSAESKGKSKEAEVYREVATAVREQKLAEEDYFKTKEARLQQTAKEMQQHGVLKATMEAAQRAQESSTKKQIISNAAYNGSLVGVKNAMVLMRAEIDASGIQLTKFGARVLLARGYVAVLTGAITTLAATMGNLLGIIGIVTAVFTMLDSVFSKNSKQAADYTTSLELTDSAVNTLANTFDKISKKDPLEKLNVASLSAKSTALSEVSDAVGKLVADLASVDKAASGWDRFWDGVKSVWGGDIRTKFSESMTDTVLGTLTKLAGSPEAEVAKKKLASILNIDPKASTSTWTAAFARIAQDVDKTNAVAAAMKELSIVSGELAHKSSEMDAALKSSSTVLGDLITKFKSKDDVANFGTSLVASSAKVAAAMRDPELAIQKLYEISSDVSKLSLFGSSDQANLIKYASKIREVNKAYQEQKQLVEASQQRLAKLKLTDKTSFAEGGNVATYDRETRAKIKAEEKALAEAKAKLQEEAVKVQEVQAKFPDLAANQFASGAKLVETSIISAMAKASTEFANAVLGAVGDVPGIAEQRTKIALQQINSETSLLKSQYDLIKATKENTAIQAERSTQEEIGQQRGVLEAARAMGDGAGISEAQSRIAALEKILEDRKKVTAAYSMGGGQKALDALRAGIADGNKEMQAQAEDLLNYINSLTNLSAQIATQADKAAAKVFEGRVTAIQELANAEKRRLQDANAEVDLAKQNNQILAQTGSLSEADLLRENAKLDATKETNNALIKQQDISARLQTLALSLDTGKLGDKARENTLAEIERLKSASATIGKEAQTTNLANTIKLEKDLLEVITKRLQFESSIKEINRKGNEAREDSLLAQRELGLQTAQDTGKYTKSYLDSLTYELEVFKTNEEAKRQENQLTTQYELRNSELRAKYDAEMRITGGKGSETSQNLMTTILAENAAYDKQKTAIAETTAAKLANKAATREAKLEQDAFNESIEAIKGLSGIFGGLADSIAGVATAFREASLSQKANLETVTALQKKYDELDDSDPSKKAAADKALKKAKEDAVKSEISGIGKVASASKKLFAEKTAAYKVFNAVEKTSQMISLALELKTSAAKIASWWAEIPVKASTEAAKTSIETTAAAAKAPLTYAEIVGQYLKSIPAPFGMVAGVAAGAFFLSLLGLGGGGKGAFVPTSEQRQETQGTAMSYDSNGKLVQTSRGVFGDTSAKSESIANSLERIKETAVEGLSMDNRVVSLLGSINEGINGSAKALYRIEGLRTGSMFGTVEGTRGGSVFSGSLGGSTSTSINDSGLIIKGTFAQLASDTNEAVLDLFEEVTKTKKSWYGKSKTSVSTLTKEIDEPISEFFSGIFSNAKDLFVEIGASAKMTAGEVETILAGVTFDEKKYSLRGLKGADLEKEVSSIISSMLDEASLAVFSSFEQYAKFGEGMLETVIRVTDTSKKVSQALENMDIKFNANALGTGLFTVTESLVNLAGGVQDFLDQTSFYAENFLDEAAQLAPAQKTVTKTFADLGIAVPKSRKEFSTLVSSLDLTDVSTHSLFQTLMDVAPAFDKVSDAAEEAAKAGFEKLKTELEDTVDSLTSFIKGISKLRENLLLGTQSNLTPLEKYTFAKQRFETTFANLSSTDAKVAATARDNLSEAATSFLDASKTIYASGEQYSTDFSSVLNKLDSASSVAVSQIDTATLQLTALNSQINLLSNIDNGISKLAGTTPLQAFAKGGYASGVALVGENGPEIVDFSSPGRVYTAEQTRGMFTAPTGGSSTMAPLVKELQELRKEVAQLRKDQKEQTGDLILSNYDANTKAAATISEVVANTASDTAWNTRSSPSII